MPTLFEALGGDSELSISSSVEVSTKIEEQIESESKLQQETTQQSFDAKQVHDLAKSDMDFFGALAMPVIFKYCFPQVFKAVWQWLLIYVHKSRDFSQLALGLPRGFGKTIVVKLFVLYCILFTSRKFILILAENQTKANNILSDIIDMLEESNVKAVFGDWKLGIETDRQDLKKFGFRGRNIILMAGTVEVIRGITLKNERPDVMIFDDIQSRTMADSQTISETLEREMIGTAMKAKSPHGCLFIFVGNMYPTKYSILRRLKSNPNWIKFIAGGILADGTSLWEELQPVEQLLREFENDLAMGRPETFYSEVLNDENASSHNLVDFSKLPEWRLQGNEIAAGKFIVIDPAGYKQKSDETAIGYFEIHDTKPVLQDLVSERMDPMTAIKKALKFALNNQCSCIFVESVAYQATFLFWFEFVCKQLGIIGIELFDINPGGISKNSRILAMFKQYQSGDIWINPKVRPQVHIQITGFNPLKKDNTDDILDVVTYAPKVLELYGEYLVSLGVIDSQEFAEIEVPEFNTPF